MPKACRLSPELLGVLERVGCRHILTKQCLKSVTDIALRKAEPCWISSCLKEGE